MPQRHLIARQTIHLGLSRRVDAFAVQQEMGRQFWQAAAPALERLFDRLAAPDELVLLDRLEINLGKLSERDLENGAFVGRLVGLVEAEIREKMARSSVGEPVKISLREGLFERWLFFLENGFFDWQTNAPDDPTAWKTAVLEKLSADSRAVSRLQSLLVREVVAVRRLALNDDGLFFKKMVGAVVGQAAKELFKEEKKWLNSLKINRLASEKPIEKRQVELLFREAILEEIAVGQSAGAVENWVARLKKRLAEKAAKAGFSLKKEVAAPSVFAMKKEVVLPENFSRTAPENDHPTAAETVLNERLPAAEKVDSAVFSDGPTAEKMTSPDRLKADLKTDEAAEFFEKKKPAEPETTVFSTKSMVVEPVLPSAETSFSAEKTAAEMLFSSFENSGEPDFSTEDKPADIESISDFGLRVADLKQPSPAVINPPPSTVSSVPFLPKPGTAIFLKNAGLVLLHPFLPRFFKNLGIDGFPIADGQNPQSEIRNPKSKAVWLLDYLATGRTESAEFDLVLPKLLCGLPLNWPLDPREAVLSEAQKEESGALLAAVVEHWGALGKSSADALREGFLQRDGQLSHSETGWKLRVERKTLDILLDRLPWGIGFVKLPWMPDPLHVEWV